MEEFRNSIEMCQHDVVLFQPSNVGTSGARLSVSAGFSWEQSFSLPVAPSGDGQDSDSEQSDEEINEVGCVNEAQ